MDGSVDQPPEPSISSRQSNRMVELEALLLLALKLKNIEADGLHSSCWSRTSHSLQTIRRVASWGSHDLVWTNLAGSEHRDQRTCSGAPVLSEVRCCL